MAGLAFLTVTSHAQLSLDFASTPGSTIQFNGASSSFQFNASTSTKHGGIYVGTQWDISGGSAEGLFGVVNNSPFYYGSITTIISGSDIDETAQVCGPQGGMVINDEAGFFLTGNVNWVQVATHDYAGGLNAKLTINVTDLTYAGTNADLMVLVAGGSGAMDLTFQFAPGKMLTDLTTGSGPYVTSYSGSISAVPEPTTLASFLLGLGVLVCSWRLKQSRNA